MLFAFAQSESTARIDDVCHDAMDIFYVQNE